jgi:hypothetical protein
MGKAQEIKGKKIVNFLTCIFLAIPRKVFLDLTFCPLIQIKIRQDFGIIDFGF